MIKSDKVLKLLDNVYEMSNVSPCHHNVVGLKFSIRQPADKLFSHYVSVKVFAVDTMGGQLGKKNSIEIRINRNTGELSYNYKSNVGVNRKSFKEIVKVIEKHYKNIVSIWDNQGQDADDFNWSI